ncbi:hypothetical protein RYX36_018275 [Vicia faba]
MVNKQSELQAYSHFVAASQLLIYVGAINILIIFDVMFMNSSEYYQDFNLWTIGDGITLMLLHPLKRLSDWLTSFGQHSIFSFSVDKVEAILSNF